MSGTLQGIRQGTDDEVMDIKHGETEIIKLGGYSMEKLLGEEIGTEGGFYIRISDDNIFCKLEGY